MHLAGFDMLDNKAKKYLRSNGVTPDTWILPEGTATFLQTVRPENRDYYLAGPAGPAGYKSALNNAQPGAIQQIASNSCAVYESKSFEVPGAPAPVDPLVREVSIGEYVTMQDGVSDVVAPKDYKSFMRDIFIYDESRDNFSRITLRNAIKACCRFDSDGNLFFPPGFKPDRTEPFAKSDNTPVYVFGDMNERYLPEEVVFKVAESIVSKFYEKCGCDEKDATGGKKAWEEIAEAAVDAGNSSTLDKFFKFVKERLPGSRVFGADYVPSWYETETGDTARDGFFFNTLAFDKMQAKRDAATAFALPAGFAPASSTEMSTALGFELDAGKEVDMAKVRKAYATLLSSSDKPSANEVALTNSTLDKFIYKVGLLGGGGKIGTGALAYNYDDVYKLVGTLAFYISEMKKRATAGNWVKKYQFVVHKSLLKIAEATNVGTDVAEVITLINGDSNDAVFSSGTVDEVNDKIRAERDGKRKTMSEPSTGLNIGAFTIPAMNQAAAFGSHGGKMATAAASTRFGALLTQSHKPHARGPGGMGFDDDAPVDEDDIASVPGYSSVMAARYEEIKNSEWKHLIKSVMLTFLHTPITEKGLFTLVDHDVFFPFEFILFRPRITHNMATGILLKKGAETGETLVGHADFQMSDDVVRKMHYGHFTLYSKTLIWKSDNIYLAENIVSTGYVGGNDVTFNTIESLWNGGDSHNNRKSIYAALVPIASRTTQDVLSADVGYFNPMDVTGRFSDNVPHMRNLDAEIGNSDGRSHYPGARYYADMWQMNNSTQKLETEFVPLQVGGHNTLCFQGHQMAYNTGTKAFDLTTLNTGHFGERVYPGCGKVRRMANQKWLQPVTYTSSFGATTHLTALGS